MKIGILTFHAQLNYGGVLQCWALQQALTRILSEKGKVKSEKRNEDEKPDEVVVVDRWLTPDNWHLERGYNHWGVKQWLKFWLRSLLGCGAFAPWLRHWRTKRFIHKQLNLTPYHFYSWSELTSQTSKSPTIQPSNPLLSKLPNFQASKHLFPSNLNLLVVGSDQVWHGGKGTWSYPTPEPYLLKDAPKVKAIAYAASFGMKALPPEYDYVAGFKRFDAISVREAEGVKLVESAGAKATHVVDPTLLLPREAWSALGTYKKKSRHVVCYFLGFDIMTQLPLLTDWARRKGRNVTIVMDGARLRAFPKKPKQLLKNLCEDLRRVCVPGAVRLVASAGPREFYRCFAEADECITDSFHAVMFSYICNCNARFLRPANEERKAMFARIEEFAQTAVQGSLLANDLSAALVSLDADSRIVFNESSINARREFSRQWLQSAIHNSSL